jgi:hypothetical protein
MTRFRGIAKAAFDSEHCTLEQMQQDAYLFVLLSVAQQKESAFLQ